jgi:hypothetical protein
MTATETAVISLTIAGCIPELHILVIAGLTGPILSPSRHLPLPSRASSRNRVRSPVAGRWPTPAGGAMAGQAGERRLPPMIAPQRPTENLADTEGGYGPTRTISGIVAADVCLKPRCNHCGGDLLTPQRPGGPPRRFCCPAHREAARLRRERGLPQGFGRVPNHHGRRRLGVAG